MLGGCFAALGGLVQVTWPDLCGSPWLAPVEHGNFRYTFLLAVFSHCTSSHCPVHTGMPLLPLRCVLPFAELPHTQAALGMGGTCSLCHPGTAGCDAAPLQHKLLTALQFIRSFSAASFAVWCRNDALGSFRGPRSSWTPGWRCTERGKGEGPRADEMKSTVICLIVWAVCLCLWDLNSEILKLVFQICSILQRLIFVGGRLIGFLFWLIQW